jgi:hypothetical protein
MYAAGQRAQRSSGDQLAQSFISPRGPRPVAAVDAAVDPRVVWRPTSVSRYSFMSTRQTYMFVIYNSPR